MESRDLVFYNIAGAAAAWEVCSSLASGGTRIT
jgi:hypothetical protein